MWEVESQTILKNLKKIKISCVRFESLTNHDSNQIKLRRKWRIFCICDSNHNFHLIWIMQHYDSKHKLHMIHITEFLLASSQSDLNHHLHMTQITQVLIFSYLALSNFIQIKISTWLESWPLMSRTIVITWLASQENGSLLLCWSCPTLLIHLNQINKFSWLKSKNLFFIYFCA